MKSKKKGKAKTHTNSRTHRKTRIKTHTSHKPETSLTGTGTTPSLTLNTSVKTCQEIEVGDIGGFGSTQELEEHQKRCTEPATEFCGDCGRNLCHNHYELLHRDHDRTPGQVTASG